MLRRHRGRSAAELKTSATHDLYDRGFGSSLTLQDPQCNIIKLPVEIMIQIVENLFIKYGIHSEISRKPAADLAKTQNTNETNETNETKCNRLWKYTSKCLRVLVAAGSVRHLTLYIHLCNPDDYSPGLYNKFKAINSLAFRILKHVEKMNLDNLTFCLDRQTAGINDIMRIVGTKDQ
jgi:hypothetical protein